MSTHALALARRVTEEVRRVGKHFLPADLVGRLAETRDWHVVQDPYLDAFLSCTLDKHDGRFWNRTYLFLPLLEVIMAEHDLEPAYVAQLLAADVVRHEVGTAQRRTEVSSLGRPDPRTLRTRVRHALRFVSPGVDLAAPAKTHLPTPPSEVRDLLDLTVQPVSTVHDEHFFIRALQAHEMAFTAMNRDVRDAITALRAQDLDLAASLLEEVVAFMDRNASLFRMVATMRPEAFHAFREFTDGASAIQSEQYKRFEGLCGTPPAARLASPAFASVPAVRAEIVAGQDTLTDAYRDAVRRNRRPGDLATTADLLQSLEASHRRWKTTHVTLASRMLGDARGSGHTSGVDYLRTWVDHRLFWQLPEIAGVDSARRSA